MLRCKLLSLSGRICSAEPWGVTLVPLMARVAGPAPQGVIPGVSVQDPEPRTFGWSCLLSHLPTLSRL